jgi:hypothetical protein
LVAVAKDERKASIVSGRRRIVSTRVRRPNPKSLGDEKNERVAKRSDTTVIDMRVVWTLKSGITDKNKTFIVSMRRARCRGKEQKISR